MLLRRRLSEWVSIAIIVCAAMMLVLTLAFGVPVFGAVPGGNGSPQGAASFQYPGEGPTTKEDCKKGGYAEFGFKNQGQCIKAVNQL